MTDKAATKEQPEKQPLINQRATLRLAVGLLIIAGLIFGYQYMRGRGEDIYGGGTKDTVGWIAAIERTDKGSQAVVFTPKWNVKRSPGFRIGANDRDLTWRPDGNQLYFSSDREENPAKRAFNIYRWNLANDVLEPRTYGTLGRSAPSFSPVALEESWPLLMVAGGNVWELDPKQLMADKMIPYSKGSRTSTGNDAQKDAGDTDTGSSTADQRIRQARWGKDRAYIAAVRRTDTGEALIVQNMTGDEKQRVPLLVVAGDKVEFDINQQTGEIIAAVQGFQWPDPDNPPPEMIKNGRAIKPFLHYVVVFDPNDPSKPPAPIVASKSNQQAFKSPAISPDGSMVALIAGIYSGDGTVEPKVMAVMPAKEGGAASVSPVISGEVYEPSWHPNGQTLVYVRRDSGRRKIFTIEKNGSNEELVGGGADYFYPRFSPQSK